MQHQEEMTTVPMGSAEYQLKYEKFDDMALGVMERNNERINDDAQHMNTEIAAAPEVIMRFDVTTAANREQNGSTTEIDLHEMLTDAYYNATGKSALPSNCCVIQSVLVESMSNTLPVDVSLKCKQSEVVRGAFSKGKVEGEESSHQRQPVLIVAHAGTEMHLSTGREICSANDFMQRNTFRKYRQATQKDVEDSATLINGGLSMEYLSPWAVLVEDDVLNGDWFMNIIYQNPSSFKHTVQAIRTQHAPEHAASASAQKEESDEAKFGISLRMHLDDWKALHTAVQQNVLDPLRKNIVDLDHDPLLTFVLEPTALPEPTKDGISVTGIVSQNNVTAWRQKSVAGNPGRCAISLKMSVKFV